MNFIILVINVFSDTLIMKKLFLKHTMRVEDAISLSKMLLYSHFAKFTITFKLNSISLWQDEMNIAKMKLYTQIQEHFNHFILHLNKEIVEMECWKHYNLMSISFSIEPYTKSLICLQMGNIHYSSIMKRSSLKRGGQVTDFYQLSTPHA